MPAPEIVPPRLARLLIALVTRPADRPFVLGDLREEFDRMVAADGTSAAKSWYWQQVVQSIAPLGRHRTAVFARAVRGLRVPAGVLVGDARQSLRWLSRHRGTTCAVVITLAVAFAAALTTFSIVNATLLRPLPFVSPERIVYVSVTGPTVAPSARATSRRDFEDWRDECRTFAALSAFTPARFSLNGRGDPREIAAVRVALDFDRVLGLRPAAGRLFAPGDYAPPATGVVLLAHRFWRSEFAASPAVLGTILDLDGRAHEIVGVLPDLDATFPLERHDVWVPLIPRQGAFWEHSRGTGWLSVVGRVRDDVEFAAAQAEVTAVARGLAQRYPDSNRDRTEAVLRPISADMLGPIRPTLLLLAAAIAAVLLVALGNISNLLLMTAAQRRQEFAVRATLGASAARLTRQVLGEILVLCLAAAALAVAAVPALSRGFVALYPGRLPRSIPVTIDQSMLEATLLLLILGVLVVGLPIAMVVRRQHLVTGLGGPSSTGWSGGSVGDRVFRSLLVTLQVALSFVLIVGGAAFVRTLDRVQRVETGYRTDGVLTFTVSPSPTQPAAVHALQFYDAVIRAIEELPGVRAAAAAVATPMTTAGWAFGVRPQGAVVDVLVNVNLTTTGYFEALGIKLLEGRLLTPDEQRHGTAVAVVNEPLARLLGGNVVGRSLDYSNVKWQIVGVVEGVRQARMHEEPGPELILPWHMAGRRPQSIVVRADGDVLGLLPAIAARVHAIDARAPLADVARLQDRQRAAMAAERFRAALLASLAAVAVGLSALGTYSVTAYAVTRRRREYGIRLALGENPLSVARRALAAAVIPSAFGVLVGWGVAVATASWVESLLYQVKALDARILGGAAAILLLLALVAGARSAGRAANSAMGTGALRGQVP